MSSERRASCSPRARRARSLRMEAGRSLASEKEVVSKFATFVNWPWWKAEWMFTSSE